MHIWNGTSEGYAVSINSGNFWKIDIATLVSNVMQVFVYIIWYEMNENYM